MKSFAPQGRSGKTVEEPSYDWGERRAGKAFLALHDGTIFRGWSAGADCDRLGEVVFNTGMTGYEEILTDPSYSGQLVAMTYPEIGNTGINHDDHESRQLFAEGLIVHQMNQPSNWRSVRSLSDYLRASGVPAIVGVDTRALTVKLRTEGTARGYLAVTGRVGEDEAVRRARDWCGLDGQDYAARVSAEQAFEWDGDGHISTTWPDQDRLPAADLTVAAYDFGIKWNILRRLRQQGIAVRVVPAGTSAKDILELETDGLFLSNGPADPAAVTYAIDNIRSLLGRLPIMGICLGHQLLGLALGGRTYRLKFGHHGCNHPVKDLTTGKVEITSQNHNFSLDPDSLPPDEMEITHINLNDDTVEGIRHRKCPAFSVQYHPEAAPGPHDAGYLFARFRELMSG